MGTRLTLIFLLAWGPVPAGAAPALSGAKQQAAAQRLSLGRPGAMEPGFLALCHQGRATVVAHVDAQGCVTDLVEQAEADASAVSPPLGGTTVWFRPSAAGGKRLRGAPFSHPYWSGLWNEPQSASPDGPGDCALEEPGICEDGPGPMQRLGPCADPVLATLALQRVHLRQAPQREARTGLGVIAGLGEEHRERRRATAVARWDAPDGSAMLLGRSEGAAAEAAIDAFAWVDARSLPIVAFGGGQPDLPRWASPGLTTVAGWQPTAVEWLRLRRGDRVLDLIFIAGADPGGRRWGQRLLVLEAGALRQVLDLVVGASGC